MAVYKLIPLNDLEAGAVRSYEIASRPLVLAVGEDNRISVFFNRCPHAGSKLSTGRVIGNRFRCPQHGYMFDLATGECSRGKREGFGALGLVPVFEHEGHLAIEFADDTVTDGAVNANATRNF